MPKIESWELALTLICFCETTLNRKKKIQSRHWKQVERKQVQSSNEPPALSLKLTRKKSMKNKYQPCKFCTQKMFRTWLFGNNRRYYEE